MDKVLIQLHETDRTPIGGFVARTGYAVERALPAGFSRRLARKMGIEGRWYLAPGLGSLSEVVTRIKNKGMACALIDHPQYVQMGSAAPTALLFEDSAVSLVRTMLTNWPVGRPVHAFSTTGLPGFAFGDMPLLPPALARLVMENASADGWAEQRHRSLLTIYGALYFLGRESEPALPAIEGLTEKAGLIVTTPATLSSLDLVMEREGWKPPIETLERLAVRNQWIAEDLERRGEWKGAAAPGWVVFYIREGVVASGKVDLVLNVLRREGFMLPPTPALTRETVRELGKEVRGGNWGRGPFPVSGGEPAQVVVAYDRAPIAPTQALLDQYPLLDNGRIQIAKQAVRDALHARLPKAKRYNGLHSTDNSVQAWRAIRSMYPRQEAALRRLERQANDA
ncbi:hypothetical protein [Pelagibacterium luteolum]|uniref:Uncharacterized protein n=1 Tax=Pelagibacterium luteolum TaxID=440168 RepID=A0A1G7S2W3_9HYPH|nr:hypothetical protein [Pelagibacterium luteolum]SDG17322.1 hypothetical protein SAMN04487974_101270 [Pelagibacterium luteolum]